MIRLVRASRLVALLLLLQARGRIGASALARELEVSVRTIQRDIESLAAAGVPVYSERGRDGGYRLVDGYQGRLTGLARDEARALVAVGVAGPAAELGLGQALLSARLKLAASLPAGLRDDMQAAVGRFHLDAPGWFGRGRAVPFLEALAAGVFGELTVQARYRGKDCLLQPLGLVLKAGVWYVVARTGEPEEAGAAGEVRGYRSDRFDSVAVPGPRFSRPDGFDLGDFWAQWTRDFEQSLPLVRVSVRARPGCLPRLHRVMEPGYVSDVDWDARPGEDGWVRLLLPFENLDYAWASAPPSRCSRPTHCAWK